jgi:glycosyltransferase involved in cell wall biosynthesis
MVKGVTILIPAYNEVRFVEKAISSAICQAEYVIVSDNNSTDGTKEICRELIKKYDNLVLIEQKENVGAARNGAILFEQLKTDYVICMGAHDIIAENYVSELMKCYEQNPDAALVYAPVKKIDENGDVFGEYLIDDLVKGVSSDDAFERVYTIIRNLSDCSIFFGMFRSDIVKKNLFCEPIAGPDHVILCNCAREGKFIRCNSTWFFRRFTNRDESNAAYMRRIVGDTTNSINRDYSKMCEEQLKTIKNIEPINIIKKNYYYYISKYALRKRWGANYFRWVKVTLLRKAFHLMKEIFVGLNSTK